MILNLQWVILDRSYRTSYTPGRKDQHLAVKKTMDITKISTYLLAMVYACVYRIVSRQPNVPRLTHTLVRHLHQGYRKTRIHWMMVAELILLFAGAKNPSRSVGFRWWDCIAVEESRRRMEEKRTGRMGTRTRKL